MRCRRPAKAATAEAAAAAAAAAATAAAAAAAAAEAAAAATATATAGVRVEEQLEVGSRAEVTRTTTTATARAKVVARSGVIGFGVKGTASILLAFLAAVSFRGIPNTPLSASAALLGDNATLIALTNSSTNSNTNTNTSLNTYTNRRETVTASTMADGMRSNQVTIEFGTTEEQTVEIWSERPDTETLTKGFSIPTYLPPFPDFIPADLPQQTVTITMPPSHTRIPTSSVHSALNKQEPHMSPPQTAAQPQPQPRLHAYDSEKKAQELRREKELAHERQQLPRRQLSLPSRNVTVQLGQNAYLPCQLHQHSNKPLSWVRLRDEHIIAVDHTTFINDARFAALLQSPPITAASQTVPQLDIANGSSLSWTLLIKYVQLQDNGWYECQLATEPKMSAKVQLLVITPKTELIGDKQRFVKAGSRVELHCIVRDTLESPKYIVWYRGDQQVMAENEATSTENGWYTQIDRNIFGNTEFSRNTIGSLVIPVVRKTHSGNYTCEPENSQAVSIQLHVLSGEYSASAIKSTAAGLNRHGHGYNSLHQWLILLLVALNKT